MDRRVVLSSEKCDNSMDLVLAALFYFQPKGPLGIICSPVVITLSIVSSMRSWGHNGTL